MIQNYVLLKVSKFQSFKNGSFKFAIREVSKFQSFKVSNYFETFKVSKFQIAESFKVSKFQSFKFETFRVARRSSAAAAEGRSGRRPQRRPDRKEPVG